MTTKRYHSTYCVSLQGCEGACLATSVYAYKASLDGLSAALSCATSGLYDVMMTFPEARAENCLPGQG